MTKSKFTPVILESPYSGDVPTNLRYLRACMADCIRRNETPYASHALLTQEGVLRDEDPEERTRGIEAGFAWRSRADKTIIYTDLGWSTGMRHGEDHARSIGHPIFYRTLSGWKA